MADQELLHVKEITKRFGVIALDRVSFGVSEGEVHGLIGENGAGKSTLIKILAGVYTRDEGRIFMDGKEVSIGNAQKATSLGLNFIHQELYQVPYFTVGETLLFGRKYPRNKFGFIDWKTLKKQAWEELSKFGVPDGLVDQLISGTSMAYRYIAAIAKAVSQKCKILFMDEPTASLTKDEAETLFDIINELKKRGMSIVYISHRLEEIFRICDRVTILREGKVVGVHRVEEVTIESVIYEMLDETLKDKFPKKKITIGDECLVVSDLKSDIVPATSFKLHQGQILGLIGLVGSGRTELAKLLFGLDKKTGGEIRIDGKKVEIKNVRDAIDSGVGLVPEDRHKEGLVLNMPLRENITLANFANYCYGHLGLINAPKEAKRTSFFVDKLRIRTASINTKVVRLSGGNQQKVAIAKWIDTKPKILIFDEPTRGIDIGSKTEVYLLIQELAKDGAGIIFISSEIEEILGITDRFMVLYKGKIVNEYRTESTTSDQVAMAMQLGRDHNGKTL